jgi:hypothetical protein
MTGPSFDPKEKNVPGHRAERIYLEVMRFRRSWQRFHRPEDLRQLLRIFPDISLRESYILDYIRLGGEEGGWIWPFARPIGLEGDAGIPAGLDEIPRDSLISKRRSVDLRNLEIDTLYSHIDYPPTPLGLFEYFFFVNELWATKSASKAADWLNTVFIFSRRGFDQQIRKVPGVAKRVTRPPVYDPVVRIASEGGGSLRYFGYIGGPWKRIIQFECDIDADGYFQQKQGKVYVAWG